jgi:phage terminase large subunit-like protein
METTIEITLTKERAEFLCKELNVWSVEARLINIQGNWATVEITGKDAEDADNISAFAFNIGVDYGRKNPSGN